MGVCDQKGCYRKSGLLFDKKRKIKATWKETNEVFNAASFTFNRYSIF